jgi:D-3-phosphoglycerate dehydrogenase
MDHRIEPLIADLVTWIAKGPRPYDEVMEAWRTSCPRLAVWEEAVDRGLVERHRSPQAGIEVRVTEAGRRYLSAQ